MTPATVSDNQVSNEDEDALCNGWAETEARRLAEELYRFQERILPPMEKDSHFTSHFDAGIVSAAITVLEHSFVCERHLREDHERRMNERLLAAINNNAKP